MLLLLTLGGCLLLPPPSMLSLIFLPWLPRFHPSHVPAPASGRRFPPCRRVGWSSQAASLDLGTDKWGFGFGGTGMRSHNRQFDKYGEVGGCAPQPSRFLMVPALPTLPARLPAALAAAAAVAARLDEQRHTCSCLQAYGLHDTLGCLLDRDAGTISFTKNGKPLGEAFQLPQVHTRLPSSAAKLP